MISNEEIINTLRESKGLLKPAAQKLGVKRELLYLKIEHNEDIKSALHELREAYIKEAEETVINNLPECKWVLYFPKYTESNILAKEAAKAIKRLLNDK